MNPGVNSALKFSTQLGAKFSRIHLVLKLMSHNCICSQGISVI